MRKKRSDSTKRNKQTVKQRRQQFEHGSEERTERRNNDDLIRLESAHLVAERTSFFEAKVSTDAAPSGCRKPKELIRIEARSRDHVAQKIPDNVESPTVVMTDILEGIDNVALIKNDQPDQKPASEEPDEPISSHQCVKEDLSLGSMGELEGMPVEEKALASGSSFRNWSQQNLTGILGDDNCKIAKEMLEHVPNDNLPESQNEICITGIRDQTLAEFTQTKSNTTSPEGSGSESGEEEPDLDMFGYTNFNYYVLEAYNAELGENILYKISLYREVIDIPDVEDINASNLKRQSYLSQCDFNCDRENDDFGSSVDEESVVNNPRINENCVPLDGDEVEYDSVNVDNVEDATSKMEEHIYANLIVTNNGNVVGSTYVDGNLNRSTEIVLDFNTEPENRLNLTVDEESAVNNPRINENCVPLDGDEVEYDSVNVDNVEDATSEMEEHIYESLIVTNNGNVVGSTYFDVNLNRSTDIIYDSNTDPENRLTSDVRTRLHSQLSSPTPKQHHIIKELIETERTHIDNMEHVISLYLDYFTKYERKRREFPEIYKIFGNIESLYESSQKVLEDLIKCDSSINCIANVFLQSQQLFELYSKYTLNKSQTQAILKTFRIPLAERQNQLYDKTSCDNYLLTPVQRPGRYKLLLETLQKDLTKFGGKNKNLDAAIRFVHKNILMTDTLLEIDSISGCPKELREFGLFLMKETFKINRKLKSVVFLFEGIIVFTTENTIAPNTYEYNNSIDANNLSLKSTDSTTFTVGDFAICKSTIDDGPFNIEIEASSEHVCKKWVEQINNLLWDQLKSKKQEIKRKSN